VYGAGWLLAFSSKMTLIIRYNSQKWKDYGGWRITPGMVNLLADALAVRALLRLQSVIGG
jgi:hypothetical protein